MADKEDTSKAIVSFPQDMPQLPDLKGKLGGAKIKASEEQSCVKEMHKEVRNGEKSIYFLFTNITSNLKLR